MIRKVKSFIKVYKEKHAMIFKILHNFKLTLTQVRYSSTTKLQKIIKFKEK